MYIAGSGGLECPNCIVTVSIARSLRVLEVVSVKSMSRR